MIESDRERLLRIAEYCYIENMKKYAAFLNELAKSEDREDRYERALIDIRDNWTDVVIIKERARSALGNEPETNMNTN